MTTPMKKMLLITGIVLGVIFGIGGIKKIFFIWMMSHYSQPPATVSSTVAQLMTWRPTLKTIGSLVAINGVEMSAELPGVVSAIRFNSGQWVKQGDVILLLDTQVEQANLKSSQAKLKLASINYQRDQILFKKKATSQSMVDTDLAQLQEAEGNLESIQATIHEKMITAPFDGYLGIRQVNLGQYIQAGTPIVTLQSLNPLYVTFNLPADDLSQLFIHQPIDVSVNDNLMIQGTITAINSKVDVDTRNIKIQAIIPNKNLTLRPGMFVNVTVLLPENKKVIVLPETAIAYSLHGDSVFVLQKNGINKNKQPIFKTIRRFVKVGERRGDLVSILEGIQPGEQVVTSGQIKLKDNTEVLINNALH